MCSLFELADAGATLFDTGGAGWPPPTGTCAGGVAGLLAPSATCAPEGGPATLSSWLFGGAERVLGAFKRRCGRTACARAAMLSCMLSWQPLQEQSLHSHARAHLPPAIPPPCRYEAERGPGGRLTVVTRLALGAPGADGGADMAAAVEAGVERSRVALLGVGGAAAGGALDLVLLEWLGDHQASETSAAGVHGARKHNASPLHARLSASLSCSRPAPACCALRHACRAPASWRRWRCWLASRGRRRRLALTAAWRWWGRRG